LASAESKYGLIQLFKKGLHSQRRQNLLTFETASSGIVLQLNI